MPTDPNARADARLEAALDAADQLDPRPSFRRVLRYLKAADPAGFERALNYYRNELVPAVAGEADPLDAWSGYGLVLAEAVGGGRLLELDSTGRARSATTAVGARGLVLHVPDDPGAPVLVLRLPRDPSPAQRAAFELLVEGRQTASAYG